MARAATRDELTDTAADAAIDQACRLLRLPTIRERHGEIAAAATRQQVSDKGFLAELLSVECDDREARRKARLVRDAAFPRPKRLEDFDYAANPNVPAALIHTLAKGAWVAAGQPCCLIGDSGTGKSHLLIGLGTAAAEAGYRVRYVTAAALVNELAEAADDKTLSRTIARYGRVDLLCLDELGYLELDRRGAELLFQVFTEREERASIAIASNAAFSNGAPSSPTPASSPPSSTGSPATPTSSAPAATPTGCAPPKPATSPRPNASTGGGDCDADQPARQRLPAHRHHPRRRARPRHHPHAARRPCRPRPAPPRRHPAADHRRGRCRPARIRQPLQPARTHQRSRRRDQPAHPRHPRRHRGHQPTKAQRPCQLLIRSVRPLDFAFQSELALKRKVK
jgi:DNA replication protein DnaC